MKNRLDKSKLLLVALALVPAFCFAEKPFARRHEIAVHAGYARLLEGAGGLTNSSGSYERKLRQGVSQNIRSYYHPIRRVSVGFLYAGFSSEGSYAAGSDRLYIQYAAPQLRFHFLDKGPWRLGVTVGTGYIHYLNDSKVYGKDRKVTGGRLACNAGLQGAYMIHPRWGISAETNLIASAIKEVDIRYHGETIRMRYSFGEYLPVSRLSFSAGILFRF
jgi:hypothetical protein